jgi:hypothetical protein
MQFIENKREEIKTDVIAQLNDADGYNPRNLSRESI